METKIKNENAVALGRLGGLARAKLPKGKLVEISRLGVEAKAKKLDRNHIPSSTV